MLILLLGFITFVSISFVLMHPAHPRRFTFDFGAVAEFMAIYYGQLLLMLIFSICWSAMADDKEKQPFDFTDRDKTPFKKSNGKTDE